MLVNLSNKIKDEYSHLQECFTNLNVYNEDISRRIHNLENQKAKAMNELIGDFVEHR
jgi:Mg2+ and Co2+ transporter CorA